MKTTIRELKNLCWYNGAIDITHYTSEQIEQVVDNELYLDKIAYSCGVYGINGALFKGHNTGTLYVITARNTNLFRLA